MDSLSPRDEFDEFLRQAASSEDERLNGELRLLQIQSIIQDGLRRANYRSLEEDHDYALSELDEYRSYARLLATKTEDGDASDQQVELDALAAAEHRALTERFIITVAAMEVSRSLSAPRPKEAANTHKKELFAELLMSERLSRSRPLFAFLNDVIPGDPVDPDADVMIPYYVTAMETVAEYEKLKQRDEQIIQDSLVAIGVEQSGDAKRYTVAASYVYMSRLGKNSAADREEAMYAAARDQRLEHPVAQKLIAYFMNLED